MERRINRHHRILRSLGFLLFCWATVLVIPFGARAQSEDQAQSANAGHLLWSAPQTVRVASALDFEAGEILVGFYQDRVSAAATMAASNAQVVETLDLRNMAAPDSGRAIYAQRMRVPAGSEWEAVLRFEQDTAVAFAMPNWRVVAAEANGTIPIVAIEQPFTVNDPLYTEEQWYLQQIQASRGWAAALALDGVGQTRIRVAVIDSGIDLDHPEFADLPVELTSYITDGFGDDVLIDDYGHGTHVAGVIAASINNGTGIAGLAPWVELDARKVLDGFGNGTISGVASAIMDAADDGAHIINMSLETFIQNPILEEAIKYSSAKGALLIAAGGNCGSPCPPPVRWPAAYPEVMAVAATNFDDTIAGYSAMGPEIEISAPGGESALGTDRIQIYSTWGTDAATRCASTTGNYQRIDGGSYCNSAGTSMAAGVVSGLAALIWGIDPDLTSEDIRAILNLTADDLNVASTRMGSGRINAAAAVRRTIDPAIEVEQDALIEWLDLGVAPFTTTLSLSNPSSRPATWEAALPNADWLHFADTESRTISGTVAYGAPVHLSLTISATDLLTGAVSGMIQIENLDTKESAGAVLVEVLTAIRLDRRYFLPATLGPSSGGEVGVFRSGRVLYNVATPDENGRIKVNMIDNSSISLDLPFVFQLKGESFTDLLLSSNGFITFPAQNSRSSLPNVCSGASSWPQEAVYGWWADLDPGKSGAQISHFVTDGGDFVIEFLNVPSAAAVDPAYKVSFQIVLYQEGDIGLNYMDLPTWIVAPPQVTIGVEAIDGQYANHIFCADSDLEIGVLPQSGQSFRLTAEDIF